MRTAVLIVCASIACAGSSASAAGMSSTHALVKFRAGTTSATTRSALNAVGARELRRLGRLNVRVVAVRPDQLERLRRNPVVEYAEDDGTLTPQEFLPSDPSFPQQFSVVGGAWGWTKTRTTQAWEITKGDPSIVVAILDTGLKASGLSDFSGQTVSGWNVMAGNSDTSSSAGNHGTYVAGVVGLGLDNGTGNAGYCPGCKVMPVQVGTDSGATWSNLATGIIWATDHGARVLNMSWAGTSPSATLADAVSYARSRGVVLTAAAGNSNCNCPTYPAATPGVIGVAGTTSSDTKETDSNYGTWVKVAAPESNMTAWPTLNGSPGYAPVGGTSLASPVVAGIAGLLFSANPGLSGSQVEQALQATAAPVGFSVQYGRVDALGALSYLGFSDPQTPNPPSNTSAPSIYVETNGDYNYRPLTGAPQVGNVLLRGQGSWKGAAPLRLSSVQWQRCDTAGATCLTVATAPKYTVQAGDAGFAFRLIVTAANGLGSTTASSPLSLPVGGAPTATPPQNVALPAVAGTPQAGQTFTASPGSWSGSPTSYGYQWRRCDASGNGCSSIAGATASAYSATAGDVGTTLRVAVTASNSAGSGTAASTQTGVIATAPAPPPPPPPSTQTLVFSGALNPKNPSRTFGVSVGQGTTRAELSFSKCLSLELNLYGGGTKIASASGPSILVLDRSLPAGTYTYEVTGGRCSFSLTLRGPAP